MRPRLAAIDLDGTLLRSDLTVSKRTRAALETARRSGVEVVPVTARSPRSARVIAADVGIDGMAICANGATVYDLAAGAIVDHRPLDARVVHRIAHGLRERVPGVVFGWELELRFGSEPAYEALRDATWPRPEGSFAPCDVLAWAGPMTKLLVRAPGADLADVLAKASALAGDDAETTLAGREFVELMARGVRKETTLARLAEERGLTAAEVVAFGDHLTDVGMLAWAGLGVAVANAQAAALEAADEVTASNDEDGVALVLERLCASLATR